MATNQEILGFKQRRLEFKAKQAIRLLGNPRGVPVDAIQFRNAAGNVKQQQQGATYHNVYSPLDIRRVRELLDPEFMQMLANPIGGLPPVICVHVTKGGVGKSSVTASLAVAYAAQGYRVLLVDGDPQGSTTETFGVETDHPELKTLRNVMHAGEAKCAPEDAVIPIFENASLDLIPADNYMTGFDNELAAMPWAEGRLSKLMKTELRHFFSQYDIVLFDTAPASSKLNFNMMIASTMVLGVVSLDGMSLKALKTLGNDVKDIEDATDRPVPVMLVANKFHAGQSHCLKNLQMLKEMYGDGLCENVIPVYTGFDRQVKVWEPEMSRPLYEEEPQVPASEVILDMSRVFLKKLVEEPRRPAAQASQSSAVAA